MDRVVARLAAQLRCALPDGNISSRKFLHEARRWIPFDLQLAHVFWRKPMNPPNRRQFLVRSGVALGLAAKAAQPDMLINGNARVPAAANGPCIDEPVPIVQGNSGPLYNRNLRTAIGLGDELASIVDKYGQIVRSRNAGLGLEFGSPQQPAENTEWSQTLLDGYLPIVETHLQLGNATLRSCAFSSDHGGVKADYVEVRDEKNPYRVRLLFPYTTSVKIEGGVVTSGGKILAAFPPPQKATCTLAKYNLLTPAAYSSLRPPWDPDALPLPLPPDTDPAFGAYRRNYLHRGIEYRFPVLAGSTYHVFMGILPIAQKPGEMILRLSVNGAIQILDYGLFPPLKPLVREFTVTPREPELRVMSECDASEAGPYRGCELSGIWVFNAPVDPVAVMRGQINSKALFYVQCGNERIEDMVSTVVLDYEPVESGRSRWFRLPYSQAEVDAAKLTVVDPESARSAEQARWDSLLQKGAEFKTGISQLDNLYKTSLVNLVLLRTKYPRQGKDGQDIYAVKPGADLYSTFWMRDGAYMTTAFDLAGLSEEAEKSLRLFWHPKLNGTLASWGQQETGLWAAPTWQWDGQGQALWALVNHYEYSGDEEWLKAVYPNIVKGVRWLESATGQTQFVNEHGERPIYFGLLPVGEGESIAFDFNYYHCFWAVLGLRQALRAAEALRQSDDIAWMKSLYEEFRSNLLASVKLACERVAGNKFIPATPFDPKPPIWGSLAALYPSRFLDPHDPMIDHTLEVLDAQAQEDTYLYEQNHLWTYITVEGAMCHLLRDEVSTFYRLYNGYVSHASPTNGWSEGILLADRKGTGDMPHGWGAAEYITIHRNSLVYENDANLELGWGVQPDWYQDGAVLTVKRAPTKFGTLDMEVERSGPELALNFHLAPVFGQKAPAIVRLHIPKLKEQISSLRFNGATRVLTPGQAVVPLDWAGGARE
jgi:hypothetical protein